MSSTVPLKSVAQTTQGGRLKLSGKDFVDDGYPAFGAGGINGFLEVAEFEKPAIVLSAIGARCGKCFLAEGTWTSLANTRLIFPDPERVDIRFLWYQLNDEARWPRSGAAQPFIRPVDVDAHEVLVPSLAEQKRIVAVLDQAFAALDRARADAEENLADAENLFGRILDEKFSQLASTESFPLIDLCGERGITYGVIKLGDHIWDGVPCLRTSNVRPLKIETDGMKSIADSLSKEYLRTILKGGEVLVNVRGTLGGVAVVPSDMAGWNISREVAMVDIAALDPFFTTFYISSTTAQNWLTGVTKGAAYKGINLSDLRRLKIPVPVAEVQEAIVRELEGQRQTIEKLKRAYTTKLDDLANLRQCLLQKAFSGQLT